MPFSRHSVTYQKTCIFNNTAASASNPEKTMYKQRCLFYENLQPRTYSEIWVTNNGFLTRGQQPQLVPFTEHLKNVEHDVLSKYKVTETYDVCRMSKSS